MEGIAMAIWKLEWVDGIVLACLVCMHVAITGRLHKRGFGKIEILANFNFAILLAWGNYARD